ncbi:hypothetical protein JCM19237_5968 [Photobacterium aphoticum]|uniref:Uncharacterized protein n=1 Tax=Photobacterium aphoticum TaxID=754436 RepID=A0A090QIX9_9GAMM|nr:hypothetical protein JCM19237_5968 [Photobacterium aphoticum]
MTHSQLQPLPFKRLFTTLSAIAAAALLSSAPVHASNFTYNYVEARVPMNPAA